MSVQVITLDQFPAWLDRVSRELGRPFNPEPWFRQLKVYAAGVTKRNIHAGVSPDGRAMKPLRFARVRGGSPLPLMDTGAAGLLGSITGNARGHVDRRTPKSIEFGTNLAYAWVHQHGGLIVPRGAKALAIPRTREALRAGSPRRFPRKLALVWPKGNTVGFLVETSKRRGQDFRSIIHYLLLPRSNVPARPFLGWTDAMADHLAKLFLDEWQRQMQRGA